MSNDKIADLKAKFVTGAIPLESDYATLLNMLEETRAATGTSPDAPKSTSLTIAPGGYMDVAVVADGGLVTGTSGLSIDTRLMWVKYHAIRTLAKAYGLWEGGAIFLYHISYINDDSMMLQFCLEPGYQLTMDGQNGLHCYLKDDVITYEGYPVNYHQIIPGCVDRAENRPNSLKFTRTKPGDIVKVWFSCLRPGQVYSGGSNYNVVMINL